MRVRLGEALRYLRQPLRERARERDDMERSFFQLLQVRKMRLEPALARAHFLYPREKRGAFRGEPDAAVLAHEQMNSQLFFERVRKVADARLRVPKLARGLLETAHSRRFQERFVFLVSHQPS